MIYETSSIGANNLLTHKKMYLFPEAERLGFDYQCTACLWGAEVLFKYHKMGWNPSNILNSLSSLCSTFGIQSHVSSNDVDLVKLVTKN